MLIALLCFEEGLRTFSLLKESLQTAATKSRSTVIRAVTTARVSKVGTSLF